jgi:hypothetical protein
MCIYGPVTDERGPSTLPDVTVVCSLVSAWHNRVSRTAFALFMKSGSYRGCPAKEEIAHCRVPNSFFVRDPEAKNSSAIHVVKRSHSILQVFEMTPKRHSR